MKRIAFSILFLFAVPAFAADPQYPPLPQAVSSFGAVTLDGYVYVYGGHAGKTHSYAVETTSSKFQRMSIADPAKGWQELPGGPHMQGLALVAHNGSVIRIGGMQPQNKAGEPANNVSLATVARFDVKANKWTPLPDLPANRSSHDAVVVGDKLIVVGGWHMNGAGKMNSWHTSTLILDLSKPDAKWESVKQPFVRRALTAAVLNGKVYVIAGLTGDGGTSHDVNIFEPESKTWSEGPKLPGDRMNGFTPAAAVLDGQLYVSPADGTLYRLAGEKWETVGALKTPRFVHRIVPIGKGKLLALGGASKGGNVAETELLLPSGVR